jgi:hypothetical protein
VKRLLFGEVRIMPYDVQKIEMEGEFKVCPACGYEDGFHSAFRKEEGATKWLFICPACHVVFDIGLTV